MDLKFFRQLFQNPFPIGAVAPLSERAALSLTKFVRNRDRSRPCKILEAGAGTGSVTSSLTPVLQEGDLLNLIEIDEGFCKILQDKFGNDPRVKIHCLSVLDWKPSYQYDFIISTLPMNIFPPEQVKKLFELYQNLLVDGGIFTYVEYIGLARLGFLFSFGETQKKNAERIEILTDLRNKYLIEQEDILTNFLPCRVYHLKFQKQTPPL